MIPIPVNPTVVVLLNNNGVPIAIASNISNDLNVKVVSTLKEFKDESCNKPFVSVDLDLDPLRQKNDYVNG